MVHNPASVPHLQAAGLISASVKSVLKSQNGWVMGQIKSRYGRFYGLIPQTCWTLCSILHFNELIAFCGFTGDKAAEMLGFVSQRNPHLFVYVEGFTFIYQPPLFIVSCTRAQLWRKVISEYKEAVRLRVIPLLDCCCASSLWSKMRWNCTRARLNQWSWCFR